MNDNDNAIAELLNNLIGSYWTGYAQHTAHVALVTSWGLTGLATAMRAHIDDEPDTINALLNRLLDIGGEPHFTIDSPRIGSDLKQVLYNDHHAQIDTRPALNRAAELAGKSHDATTRTLLERILEDEENHLYWLATEIDLYERLGDALYVANRLS